MRPRISTLCIVMISWGLGCGPARGPGAAEPDLDAELEREAEAKASGESTPATAPTTATPADKQATPVAPKGKLIRFDLDRGKTRNGAGFRVLARETPAGGRVVAFEFDGILHLGEENYKGGKFGGVALVSFDSDGKMQWSHRIDHKDYHYIAALEVTEDGDILAGGSFGDHGMILTRLSSTGEVRWTFQPTKEPKWAEVSSFVLDAKGDVVLSGLFQSRLSLPGQTLKAKYFDGYVAKLDGQTGDIRWIKQLKSAEAKASAVYVAPETGDVFVAGDYRKFLKVDGKQLKDKRSFFFARFSADGAVQFLAPVVSRFAGNVISIQPMSGNRAVLHLRDPNNSELIAVSEEDGVPRWVVEDTEEGGALIYDARRRPDAVLYAVHDADPRFGSSRVLIREIAQEDKVRTVKVVDAGPFAFMSRGTVRRATDGSILISGSLRDDTWDNDGFYPYLLDLAPDARRLNLKSVPTTGRGSGTRCKQVLPQKLVWRDLRVAVQQQRRPLSKCVANPGDIGAVFDLKPDGTVTDVTIEGDLDEQQSTCVAEVLRTVRVCPYKGGPYKRRMAQLQ